MMLALGAALVISPSSHSLNPPKPRTLQDLGHFVSKSHGQAAVPIAHPQSPSHLHICPCSSSLPHLHWTANPLRKAAYPSSWWPFISLPIRWSASQHTSIYLTSVMKHRSSISVLCGNKPFYRGNSSAIRIPPEIIIDTSSTHPANLHNKSHKLQVLVSPILAEKGGNTSRRRHHGLKTWWESSDWRAWLEKKNTSF